MSNELTTLGAYCDMTDMSLEFNRDVSETEWQEAFKALNHIEGCVQFWIGDCLAYREQKWGMYDDALEASGKNKDSLRDYALVSNAIESARRLAELSFGHHRAVLSLAPDIQDMVLERAVTNKWSVKEIRTEVKKIKRGDDQRTIEKIPANTYSVLYVDPPWMYNDKQETDKLGGAEKHYPTMSIEDMKYMDIPQTTADAVLFIWVTSPLLEECFEIINEWGFKYKSSFIWDKVGHNMGHYNSVRHEFLLICTKGSCTPEVKKLFDSVQSIEKTKKHSEKPAEFGEIINTLYPSAKKIEMFCRTEMTFHDDKWTIWGNEV